LTSLTDYSPAYSLTGIILDQARVLKRYGYPYTLFCLKAFNSNHKKIAEELGIEVSYELPQTRLHPYKVNESVKTTIDGQVGFDDQVNIHFEGCKEKGTIGYRDALASYDTIITHDLMFLEWHLPQNAAIRKCIDLYPNKNWLHWIHSGPSNRPNNVCYPSTLRYSAAPNSTYVFLNDGQRLDCALMLQTTRDNIAVVHNPKDVRDVYNFQEETKRLTDEYDLFNFDLLQVYPFSTPRWEAKGVKHLICLVSHWKKMGVRAKVVFVNAHCNSPQDKPHLKKMEEYCEAAGVEIDRDIIFTHRFASKMEAQTTDLDVQKKWKTWHHCVPFEVVRDLNMLANIFVFPSATECCSLIQAEASISGKFMVLNRDFLPMMEFASPKVLSYEFKINDPDNQAVKDRRYYEFVAREIWAEIQTETAVMNTTKARTETYNRDWIFQKQLEPILWKKFTESDKPPEAASDPVGEVAHVVPNYNDPQPGDECPIYKECTPERRTYCYEQSGHCLMLDEVLEVSK
jgi:hypothetical protein